MNEAFLYNLANSSPSKNTIAEVAIVEVKKLMAEHLYREHKIGPRKIAQILKLKQKEVAAILNK